MHRPTEGGGHGGVSYSQANILPKLSCLCCSPKGLDSAFICLIFTAASAER